MKLATLPQVGNTENKVVWLGSILLPVFCFWLILVSRIPYSFSQYFHSYSLGAFLGILCLYYVCFRLSDPYRNLACLTLTLILFALSLSYMWTSGYSDNKIVAGLLPYKDGAGYYYGANLIVHGLPLENTVQSGWRPLFPGFLSSLLLLTDGNLKWALAILALLAAMGTYYSSRQVFTYLGVLPASLFITFLYFYIQPLIGLTMTEMLGFAIACCAFSMLWQVAYHPTWSDLVLGLLVLVLALSARAGTFFILPLLALWSGRIFRGEKMFSYKMFCTALVTILFGYFFVNVIYVRLIGVPEGRVFGNFAYSLYGQVRGGTGWHYAIDELGTKEPSVIYREAFLFFRRHPFSLLIGVAKSYRDFLIPSRGGILPFDFSRPWEWANFMAWGAAILLTMRGLLSLIRNRSASISLLLLAGFTGIFLSIPFLPPIDGGSRFYASTVPFFFIIPVLGLAQTSTKQLAHVESFEPESSFLRAGSIIIFFLTAVVPLLTLRLASTPSFSVPECPAGQSPFVMEYNSGSYVDLISSGNSCGTAPTLCFVDFDRNGVEMSVDDFYQKLYSLAKADGASARIIPAINFADRTFHYFYLSHAQVPNGLPLGRLSGCALEIETKNNTIYQVETILPSNSK